MKIKKNTLIFTIALFSTEFSTSWCSGILYTSEQNGKTQLQAIGNDSSKDLPSLYYSTRSSSNGQKSVLATGSAAKIIAENENLDRSDKKANSQIDYQIAMSDLKIINDNENLPIAALHPIFGYFGYYVTALHALHNSNIFKILPNNYQIYVFQDQYERYLDIAFVAPNNAESKIAEIIQLANRNTRDQDVYFNQLNHVDGTNELALSQSQVRVQTENDSYMFLEIDQHNLLAPSSSGAPVYLANQNNLIATVVCKSQLNNPRQTDVIRAIKISSLKNAQIKKIIDQQIPTAQSLNCERYDGRRGGG